MSKHLKTVVGTWIGLLSFLVLIPGFEMRGLAMGLIIGGWPFLLISWHSMHPVFVGLVMLVLSGLTVCIFAWCMDKAKLSGKWWVFIGALIIIGAGFLSRNNISYEQWKRTPSVSAAMESPEANYQPSRADFNNQVIVPKALTGCMLGFYVATGICFTYAAAVLLIRRYLLNQVQL